MNKKSINLLFVFFILCSNAYASKISTHDINGFIEQNSNPFKYGGDLKWESIELKGKDLVIKRTHNSTDQTALPLDKINLKKIKTKKDKIVFYSHSRENVVKHTFAGKTRMISGGTLYVKEMSKKNIKHLKKMIYEMIKDELITLDTAQKNGADVEMIRKSK